MRIALVGKGGSGKTTVASLLLRYLMAKQKPTLAIDADINQHLADAIGWEVGDLPEVGNKLSELKTILIGENKRIPSVSKMVKTTLPGEGSHLIRLQQDDQVLKTFAKQKGKTWFMRIGGFTQDDLGQRCYHAKTGGAELILNHLIDDPQESIIVDMTAGADAFASGLFSRFDLTLIVVEPTVKSVSVYEQYKAYAQDYGIAIRVVGNKVENAEDQAFLQEKCGKDILGCLSRSQWVKRTERGEIPDLSDLETENFKLLKTILQMAEEYPRDWQRYWQWGINFHKLNAQGWANDAVGSDVTHYIDENFLKSFQAHNAPDEKVVSIEASKPSIPAASTFTFNSK